MRTLQDIGVATRARHQFEWFWDFHHLVTAQNGLTTLVADVGTSAAVGDAATGVAVLGTAATDNNEAMVRSTAELFLFGTDRTIFAEFRIQYAEANTDDANVAVGFADVAGANVLLDDGAGVAINASGALIYKVDGGTVWRCNSENNSVVTDTVTNVTAGGASYVRLGVEARPVDGTNYEINFFIDGREMLDSNGRRFKHTLAYASATEMRLVAGYVKAGGANAETLNLDYFFVAQKRV